MPVLQGARSATTSGNGDYIVPFLPPGEYLVEYALAGFQKRTEKVRAATGQAAIRVDVSMKLAALTEVVEVTARAGGSFDQAAAVSTTDTLSRLRGNFTGETAASGPVAATNLNYPEYAQASWNLPLGDLSSDQRHKLRAWVDWRLPAPAVLGRVNLGVLHQYNPGSPYGALGAVDTRSFRTVAGYSGVPSSFGYWFTARDAFHTDENHRTDIALNWSRKLGVRQTEIFFRGTVQNAANNQAIVTVGTGIADRTTTSRLRRFDPFTTTPVEGVDWEKAATFGRPK